MLSFLKTCGRGFIVIISSPLWLLFFALYIVYGLMLFIYMVIKAIVKLFSKNHLTIETEYDKKAKIILSNPSFDFRYGTTNRQDIYPQQQYFYQPQIQQPTYQPQPQPQPAPQYNNPNYQQQPGPSNFNSYNNGQVNNQFVNFNNTQVNSNNYQPQGGQTNINPQQQTQYNNNNQQYNNNYGQNDFNNNQYDQNNNGRNE